MIDIKKALTSEYAPAYTATNEDIRWIVDAYPNARDILTVAGSGDQALFYAQNGTRHVDTFDITRMAKMIQDIKTTALRHLNHTEYKQFLVDICRNKPNPNTSKIIANMPNDSRELLTAPLPPMKFKTRITIDNPNLPTWTEYEHMRKNITQPFNFICAPLSTLGKHITKQYDIINVSNIFDNFYGDNLSSAGAQMETIMGLCANLKLGGHILYIPQNRHYDFSKIIDEQTHGCKCMPPIQHPTDRFTQIIPIQRTR